MHREQTYGFSRELKEAISDVKRHEYERELLATLDPAGLRTIDYMVRADSQLTVLDRLELLGEMERLAVPVDPGESSWREEARP